MTKKKSKEDRTLAEALIKMDSEEAHQKDNNGDEVPIAEEQGDASQNSQSQQKPQRTPAFANQLPPSVSQQRSKPKRSTNTLHLLFLESCKMVKIHTDLRYFAVFHPQQILSHVYVVCHEGYVVER